MIFILSLFIFGLNRAYATPLSLDELKNIASQMRLRDEVLELSCPSNDESKPEALFLFDGALGFCPNFFILNLPQADGQTYLRRLKETPLTVENKSLIQKIKKKLKAEDSVKNCLLVKTALGRFKKKIHASKLQVLYYSKNGNREAVECAKSMFAKNELKRMKAVGYSMGSHATLEFAKGLEENKIVLDQVLTVDPVGKDMDWRTGVVGTADNPIFLRTENVKTWINYYQKQDYACLVNTPLFHIGIRGSYFVGADLNREIKAAEFTSERARYFGHVHILNQPMVLKALEKLF